MAIYDAQGRPTLAIEHGAQIQLASIARQVANDIAGQFNQAIARRAAGDKVAIDMTPVLLAVEKAYELGRDDASSVR